MKAVLTLLTALLFATQAMAADGAEEARKFLRERHGAVMKILQQGVGDEGARDAKLKAAIGDLLDYQELSKRALDDHWDSIATSKRDEFVDLLSKLVERSYQKNLESTIDFKVSYGKAKAKGDSILIETEARSLKNRRAPAVEIDYTLFPMEGSYRVYDVTTDGVSLVTNYRRQFNKIIRREGIDGLLERMKKRLADGGDNF